jgi:hypothetical protein
MIFIWQNFKVVLENSIFVYMDHFYGTLPTELEPLPHLGSFKRRYKVHLLQQ